jgi:hypothetical protein
MNELRGEVSASYVKPSDHDGDGAADTNVTYQRFVTNRFSVGPYFYVTKVFGTDTTFSGIGGRADYHFGRLSSRWIPFVDFRIGPGFGEGPRNPFETELLGGVKVYTGKPGAFLMLGPYFYHASYNTSETGFSSLNAFGVSWSIGVVF